MLSLDPALESIITPGHHTLYLASCWRIARPDGTIFRLTNANSKLTLADDQQFQPAGGFSTSARKKATGLKVNNLELFGMLDDSVITGDDLRAGRYQDALITEYIVDARVPWLDIFSTDTWKVVDVTWRNGQWDAEIADLSRILRQGIGRVISRNCDRVLGDDKCGVDLGPLTVSSTVSAITVQRQHFTTALTGEADNFYKYGGLTFTSGANAGFTFPVQKFLEVAGAFYLPYKTPYDIAASDGFDVYPGCPKTYNACGFKANRAGTKIFDNIVNYGGFPWTPGNDKMLEYPSG